MSGGASGSTGGEGEPGYRERAFTSQDGLRLYFRDYGDPLSTATPVLCLSGLTRNSKDFHHIAARVSSERRVLCLDYRGRGRSEYDADWRRYQARTYAEDVRHLLAVTNVHKVAVIGTSLGGVMAMIMAAAMPCALAGAVINDIGPEIEGKGLARIIAYIRNIPPLPDWEAAARYMQKTLPDFAVGGEDGWMNLARNTFRQGDDGRLYPDWDSNLIKPLRDRDGGASVDLWPLFRALGRIPLLAIRGSRSDVLSEDTFERMAAEVPGLARVTVPGVGHVPSLAEPEAAEAIDALLARA